MLDELETYPGRESIKCMVRPTTRAKSIRETAEVTFVDDIEYLGNCTLDSSSDAMPSARCPPSDFGMCSAGGLCSVGPAMEATVEILDIRPQIYTVILPSYAVDTSARLTFERQERSLESFSSEMAEQIVESDFLVPSCELTYTVQRTGHALPALCPGRVLLVRVSLGQIPSLHHLRRVFIRFVRRLRR